MSTYCRVLPCAVRFMLTGDVWRVQVRADLLESVEACRAALPPAGTVVAAAGNDNGAGSSTVRMGMFPS